MSDFVFNMFVKNRLSSAIVLLLHAIGGFGMVLGLVGFVPAKFSWASLFSTPFLACYFLLLNRQLLRALSREFDFWGLILLSTIACASFVEMVWDDPDRIVGVIFLLMGSIAVVCSDARPVFRKKSPGYRYMFLTATLVFASIIVLYHANVWENYRSTVFHIGVGKGINFHVASTGMGCAITLCALTGRYAWILLRSSEVNPMVVIRAPVVLRAFTKGSKATPQQSPHAVLRRVSVPIVTPVIVESPSVVAVVADCESR